MFRVIYILKILIYIVTNFFSNKKVHYVVENAPWSIKHDGEMITKNLKFSRITYTHHGLRNSIVHFGSVNLFFSHERINLPHKSNKIIVTWFHIVPGDSRVKFISEAIKHVDFWHTSCQISRKKMIELGIPDNKIIIVPLGVDIDCFKPVSQMEKNKIRSALSIPENAFVIGSFQKDGIGWGQGYSPKLIKGPDLFCESIEFISKRYPVFVLLTGPSRGYVKNRLRNSGIAYTHVYLDKPEEVARYYQVLDLYLISSREEGGPKSLLESLASGIPLLSTPVGMAPELLESGVNGFVVNDFNAKSLIATLIEIIEHKEMLQDIIDNGFKAVRNCDWKDVSFAYDRKIYSRLM